MHFVVESLLARRGSIAKDNRTCEAPTASSGATVFLRLWTFSSDLADHFTFTIFCEFTNLKSGRCGNVLCSDSQASPDSFLLKEGLLYLAAFFLALPLFTFIILKISLFNVTINDIKESKCCMIFIFSLQSREDSSREI